MNTYKIGQEVNYSNGNPSIYTGTIVSINNNGNQLVIIDDKAGMELFNAGYAVGSCIHPSQIKPEPIRPARQFNVGLWDYVTAKKLETITLTAKENQKMSEACKEWMKQSYGGRIYVETYDNPQKPGYLIKQVFSEDSDFFLMFGCKNNCSVS
jgi:hypothetical protein